MRGADGLPDFAAQQLRKIWMPARPMPDALRRLVAPCQAAMLLRLPDNLQTIFLRHQRHFARPNSLERRQRVRRKLFGTPPKHENKLDALRRAHPFL